MYMKKNGGEWEIGWGRLKKIEFNIS